MALTADTCPCGHGPAFCHVQNARKWCGQSVAAYTEGVKAERDLLRSVVAEISAAVQTPATDAERVDGVVAILNTPRVLP